MSDFSLNPYQFAKFLQLATDLAIDTDDFSFYDLMETILGNKWGSYYCPFMNDSIKEHVYRPEEEDYFWFCEMKSGLKMQLEGSLDSPTIMIYTPPNSIYAVWCVRAMKDGDEPDLNRIISELHVSHIKGQNTVRIKFELVGVPVEGDLTLTSPDVITTLSDRFDKVHISGDPEMFKLIDP